MDIRWRFLVAVVVSVCRVRRDRASIADFPDRGSTSPMPGQDGFEPQVAVDRFRERALPSGRAPTGRYFRIQYSTRTANGDWSTPVNDLRPRAEPPSKPQTRRRHVGQSAGGVDALRWHEPAHPGRVQALGRQLRHAGQHLRPRLRRRRAAGRLRQHGQGDRRLAARSTAPSSRVQATHPRRRPGGRVRERGDAFRPRPGRVRPADRCGSERRCQRRLVWTRSDGTNLRVQAARRRDYVGFPRPSRPAPCARLLVPAYDQCSGRRNRVHGPPLAFASCNPPVETSTALTVGTRDANGSIANSMSSVRWKAIVGNAATEANEADVQAIIKITDVRNNPTPARTTPAALGGRDELQITDQRNAAREARGRARPRRSRSSPGPMRRRPVRPPPGAPATRPPASTRCCPGAVLERKRAIWELGPDDRQGRRRRTAPATPLVRRPAVTGTRRSSCARASSFPRGTGTSRSRLCGRPRGRPQPFLAPRVGPGRRRYPFDHPRGSRGSFLYLDRLGPADRLDPEEWLAEKYESR